MPRAYTKSGSTEKYESSQWSIYWKGNTGTCTGPDASTGEYTITAPSGMSITSTKNDTSYCLTIYGGVQNWFYFENNRIIIKYVIKFFNELSTTYSNGNMDFGIYNLNIGVTLKAVYDDNSIEDVNNNIGTYTVKLNYAIEDWVLGDDNEEIIQGTNDMGTILTVSCSCPGNNYNSTNTTYRINDQADSHSGNRVITSISSIKNYSKTINGISVIEE